MMLWSCKQGRMGSPPLLLAPPWQAGVVLDPVHMEDIEASIVNQQAMGVGGGRTADVRD